MNYDIDNLDKQILRILKKDSRRPFLEIARELKVSGGTVHVRVNKLKEAGVIKGSKTIIDYQALGYSVSSFVGIRLSSAAASQQVQKGLASTKEITEVHYTTGNYSLLVKIMAKNINDLYRILSEKLQTIEGILSTETYVILNTDLDRDLDF